MNYTAPGTPGNAMEMFIALDDLEYAGHQMTFQNSMQARVKKAKPTSG
jgi:hypothetical protein